MGKDPSLEKEDVSVQMTLKMKDEKEPLKMGRVRGKAFQADGTASTKTLRPEKADRSPVTSLLSSVTLSF